MASERSGGRSDGWTDGLKASVDVLSTRTGRVRLIPAPQSLPTTPRTMKTLDDRSSEATLRAAAGLTVLVADDENAVRRFAVRILEGEGFVVVEARDGAEALDAV